jgi:hypothetical protein
MAATTQRAITGTIDELSFNNTAVSMCMIVNRRHATVRVIDFRAGATLAKRNFVLNAARREGIEKIFVLVERDEVHSWSRLGFHREGCIPSFYRRSDAWIMGAVVAAIGPMRPERAYGEDDDDDDIEEPVAAIALADKAVDRAKKLHKETSDKPVPQTKIAPCKRDLALKAVSTAAKAGRALTGFEHFSRDAERHFLTIAGKGGFEVVASYEVQPNFASSMVELLTGPRDESERQLTTSALRSLVGHLAESGTMSAFSIAPADDVPLGSCFIANGFRKSAVLPSHLVVGGKRKDGIVWSKKLADN